VVPDLKEVFPIAGGNDLRVSLVVFFWPFSSLVSVVDQISLSSLKYTL